MEGISKTVFIMTNHSIFKQDKGSEGMMGVRNNEQMVELICCTP